MPLWVKLSIAAFLGVAVQGTSHAQSLMPGSVPDKSNKGSLFDRFRSLPSRNLNNKSTPLPKEIAEPKENQPATILEAVAEIREKELKILFRRQAVCEKLRQIGLNTNDDALLRKAEELDNRAWEVYMQRTNPNAADVTEGTLEVGELDQRPIRFRGKAMPSPRVD